MISQANTPILTRSLSGLFLCLLFFSPAWGDQSADSAAPPPEYYNDGPHVFWQSDTSAVVFYLCDGEIIRQRFRAGDSLRFTGFCNDNAAEYVLPAATPGPEPDTYAEADRIFAVSDIHGEYDYFASLLRNAGIIDADGNWDWGNGHLVIVGDVFDRGEKVTECLWLIHRLERQARAAGGRVHLLLGNHELMILRGDDRYIHDRYKKGIIKKSRIAHRDLYGLDMALGRWLRSKHTMVRISGLLFTHAGVPPYLVDSALTAATVNELMRSNLDLRSSQLAFNDQVKFLYGGGGPVWYRGFHEARADRYPMATSEYIDNVCRFYDVTTIIVGHSEQDSLLTSFDGRVISIDIPADELQSLEGVLWQDGVVYGVDGGGRRRPLQP